MVDTGIDCLDDVGQKPPEIQLKIKGGKLMGSRQSLRPLETSCKVESCCIRKETAGKGFNWRPKARLGNELVARRCKDSIAVKCLVALLRVHGGCDPAWRALEINWTKPAAIVSWLFQYSVWCPESSDNSLLWMAFWLRVRGSHR